jgi:hypothetical protein
MWQMYSSDCDTQASFYGVMKASEPRHVQLDLSTHEVDVINTSTEPLSGAKVEASVYSLANQQLFSKTAPISVAADDIANVFQLPLADSFAGTALDAPVFVRLNLLSADGRTISTNFYWLAAHEEDMRKINTLPQADVATTVTTGRKGAESIVTVVLTNRGKQAAIELKLTLQEALDGRCILQRQLHPSASR